MTFVLTVMKIINLTQKLLQERQTYIHAHARARGTIRFPNLIENFRLNIKWQVLA
jgi:hypothetical protein